MLIRPRDDGFVHPVPSEITPRAVYEDRRRLLRWMAGGAAGAALAAWAQREALAQVQRPGKLQALQAVRQPLHLPSQRAARDRLFSHPLATREGLVDLWRSAGLADVRCESATIRMDFADFADYWDPLLGGQGPVGTYVNGLAPATRQIVRENVRAAFLSGAPDGPRSMTATAWVVQGRSPQSY